MFCFGYTLFKDAPLAGYIGIKNVREIYANGSKLSLDVSYAVFCGRSLTGNFSFFYKVPDVSRPGLNLTAYKEY